MIELSIVSGTYNRIRHLTGMVASARRSIGIGIPYEIVIVDGGSTDGTLEWCKKQPDIRLIEHGELLGAVKAFNDGARAAQGRYVILANDDIEFVGHSLLSALSFIHDNPQVGIGCFYQDRRGWDWHVEQMPGVKGGRQVSIFYGQVCIVPKWLGDKVGWWGNYLRTYGGDNELSCNVWELGYRVEPMPCAYIHDTTPMDELRKINNIMPATGDHPDTAKWKAKWTRNGKLGPIVRDTPIEQHPDYRIMRIFYMPIFEPGNAIQKQSKRGLRDALSKIGLVYEFDYLGNSIDTLLEVSCLYDPHLFVMQLQDAQHITYDIIRQLRARHPGAVFVNWNGDYHPDTLLSDGYILLAKQFDLVGVVTTIVKDVYNANGVNWFYWQIGYEPTQVTKVMQAVRRHDVIFLANGYSKDRLALASALKSIKGLDVGLYGQWPASLRPNGNTLYDFNTGAELYQHSKIAIGDSQWPDATGFVSNRLFQALEAGAFLMHQYFDGMEELLGLVDGEHLIVWRDIKDLMAKIVHWLPRDIERARIAAAGQEFVKNNHSFDIRIAEMLRQLEDRKLMRVYV